MASITLYNGNQSATFAELDGGYRPEWFRLGNRPMLRFKDHEWLSISIIRVSTGQVVNSSESSATFSGIAELAGEPVDWTVSVSVPKGGSGFLVESRFAPRTGAVEVLEALTTFELPYEYDGTEQTMTVMAQQPVYRYDGSKELDGAGYNHPNWYYARPGLSHLTFPSSSPLFAHRIANADGSNERCTVILGNWNRCSFHDMFAVPTRQLRDSDDIPFEHDTAMRPGLRGHKFLIGAGNWNTSLYKDPNWLVDPGTGLTQELVVNYRDSLGGLGWDGLLASGWERLASMHYPADGKVEASRIAREQGASWTEAADWLATQFTLPDGKFGFFNPDRGPYVYAPGTRPRGDNGVEGFAGQWTGPLALLGKVWGNQNYLDAANRCESIFAKDHEQNAESVWVIGPTPMFVGILRKASITGIDSAVSEHVEQYLRARTNYHLNPVAGKPTGDGGILSWDAFANLLAADHFDRHFHEDAARRLLENINARLDNRFWSFNCAAEGELVGAGQARPFGHGFALAANALAYKRFGDPVYLSAAERFGNLLLAMHFITYNDSQSADLDTRGWANGSTGGRDQLCHLPPWETGLALQQFAHLIELGKARSGVYDVLWMFSHTGLAQFPKARTHKRLYTADLKPVYRPIDSLATERQFYRSLPYLAYEEPWDQTLLASYQGVEPVVQALLFGGGMVAADDDRILAVVPGAATYQASLERSFAVHLWNPTTDPIATTLSVTTAARRGLSWRCSGSVVASGGPGETTTDPIIVPPRQVLEVRFEIG